jgi:hypothetical protein
MTSKRQLSNILRSFMVELLSIPSATRVDGKGGKRSEGVPWKLERLHQQLASKETLSGDNKTKHPYFLRTAT